KYTAHATAAARTADTASNDPCSQSSPASQHSTAQSQRDSNITSHITFVPDTRKAGVNNASTAARTGSRQNRRAIAKTARIDIIGQIRNARCRANSLHPKTDATNAIQ